jgi:hypothetical protein
MENEKTKYTRIIGLAAIGVANLYDFSELFRLHDLLYSKIMFTSQEKELHSIITGFFIEDCEKHLKVLTSKNKL